MRHDFKKGITLLELAIVMAVVAIVMSGVFITLRTGNDDYRTLLAASVQLQADMRYVQRRAIMEGRNVGISFDRVNNRYSIVYESPLTVLRTESLPDGVVISHITRVRLVYLPRGTPSQGGFSVLLLAGSYGRSITVVASGGRVRINEASGGNR